MPAPPYDDAWLADYQARAAGWRGTGGARSNSSPPATPCGRVLPPAAAHRTAGAPPGDEQGPAASQVKAAPHGRGHCGHAGRGGPEPSAVAAAVASRVAPSGGSDRGSFFAEGAKKGTHKYSAVATDGPDGSGGTRKYRSKLEARLASYLDDQRRAGGVVCFIPECSIPVGEIGGRIVRHVIDQLAILEVRQDGTFIGRFIESKGMRAPVGERKRKAVRSKYGIEIQVIKRGDI